MLGPFHLDTILARGGTAVVWRAHYGDGRPGQVAVKVLMEERARDAEDLSAFRSEVRAAARLIHPHIASVLDYGEVPADQASEELPRGSPWLAMELGSGTLHERCGSLDWAASLAALRQLLGALAHAHAHGLIHRDVKPRNLLRVGEVWKLGDFGLAHVVDGQGDTRVIGTPSYMAPEHFAGAWRDHGPWTDLYSVGCLAWHLVCGRPPFHAATSAAILREAHQTWPVPTLRPQHPVPSGLEGWVRRLMGKRPQDRPRWAADALLALNTLGPAQAPRATPVLLGARVAELPTAELDLAPTPAPSQTSATPARMPRPPFPKDWRSAARLPPPAGLGLLALRARPVVGREQERTLLWRALGQVVESGQLQVVGLMGAPGLGKSHLAEWLATEAHAHGLASILHARWSHARGPLEGLAPLVRDAYRLQGLDPSECRQRLARLLRQEHAERPDHEARQLSSLLHPPPPSRASRFAAEEQRAALRRMLLRRGSQDQDSSGACRPVVLILDELQFGPEGMELLELLRSDPKLPLLVLVTSAEPAPLQGLLDLSLELAPLPEADLDTLLRGVLGLSPDLALQVQHRAQGNPAFALQLVEAWVDQSALTESPQGLKLRHEAALPESLRLAWSERLEALLQSRPEGDALALELAALSGRSVNQARWLKACARAGCTPSRSLLDLMLRSELAKTYDSGWRFAHAWVREALTQRAKDHGRWPMMHALLAAGMTHSERAGERGLHYLEAGDWSAALRDLSAGQEHLLSRGQLARAALLDPHRQRALRALSPPASDPMVGQDLLLRARLATGRGESTKGLELATAAVRAARAEGWKDLEARALLEGGRLLHRSGELARARRWLRRGVRASMAAGKRGLTAHCRELLASCESELGEALAAAKTLNAAWEDYEAIGDPVGMGSVHLGLSFLSLASEDLDDAEEHARVALEHCTGVGAERMRCAAMTVLGDVARARAGAYAQEAERWFDKALRRHRASGRLYAVALTQLNLALTALERADQESAKAALQEVQRFQQGQGAGNLLALTWLALALVAAREGAPEADLWFNKARLRLRQTGQVHRDLWGLCRMLAESCRAQGWLELSQSAQRIATQQALRLGKEPPID